MSSLRHLCLVALLGMMLGTAAAADTPRLLFETTAGDFEVELFPDRAPVTVDNFLDYVDTGFFDDLIFHRVVPGFVIQTGGYSRGLNMRQPNANIINESIGGPPNRRGTLSMARLQYPHSANSQFFINLRDNPSLNATGTRPGYAVFGRVTEGMDVIDAIAQVETTRREGMADVPVEDVTILRVRRLEPTP